MGMKTLAEVEEHLEEKKRKKDFKKKSQKPVESGFFFDNKICIQR